jgi:hypothetical protein
MYTRETETTRDDGRRRTEIYSFTSLESKPFKMEAKRIRPPFSDYLFIRRTPPLPDPPNTRYKTDQIVDAI